jgi:DNA polymerase-1
VLGTIGKTYSAQGAEVTILSGDRDLLQLVDENIKLLIPKTNTNYKLTT